jgi:hypothetical protein
MIVKINAVDAMKLGFNEIDYGIYLCGLTVGEYAGNSQIAIDMDQEMPKELRSAILSLESSADYWRGINESKKIHRRDQAEHVKSFVEKYDHEIINEGNHHYRLNINGTKIDVWLSTTKHSVTGSNKFNKGLKNLKKLIAKYEKKDSQN